MSQELKLLFPAYGNSPYRKGSSRGSSKSPPDTEIVNSDLKLPHARRDMSIGMDLNLGDILQKVSQIKLRGGVVGNISTVVIVVSICITAAICISGDPRIIIAGIALISILAFVMLWKVINFADRNPQAALLEGSEFLVHQQLLLGTKQDPVILVSPESFTEEERSTESPLESLTQLDEAEDVQTLLPSRPADTGK